MQPRPATEIHVTNFTLLESPQTFISPSGKTQNRSYNNPQTYYLDVGNAVTKGGNLAVDENPVLVCPSRTFRTRRQNIEQAVSGNNIFSDSSKVNAKSVLECLRSGDQKPLEDFMDYALSELEVTQKDRLFFTEPIGLYTRYRDAMFELGFECYNLSEMLPIVEPIAASYQQWKLHQKPDSLLISIGAGQSLVLPFINSNLDTQGVRRVSIGTESMRGTFVKLFNLKYPSFVELLSNRQINGVFDRFAFASFDYRTQMRFYQELTFGGPSCISDLDDLVISHLRREISLLNIPSDQERARSRAEKAAQQEKKQETLRKMAERLRESLEAKRRALEAEYEKLSAVEEEGKTGLKGAYKSAYQGLGFEKEEDFTARLAVLRKKLGHEKPIDNPDKFKLLEIPDEELSPKRLKSKRYLAMQKAGMDKRLAKRIEKEAKLKEIERMKTENPAGYVDELKQKRLEIKAKLKRMRYFKEDPFFKKQKNNQIIERIDKWLAGKSDVKGDDNDDNDFAQALLEASSDCEKYDTEMQVLNGQIKELQPEFDEDQDDDELFISRLYEAVERVDIGADLTRSVEALFRPQLIGSPQKGLFESVRLVLDSYDPNIKERLLNNIYVVGGGACISGMTERLQNDLWICFSGKGASSVKVHTSNSPVLTGYQGARSFFKDYENKLAQWAYTKAEYEEHGSRLFKTCPIGNI